MVPISQTTFANAFSRMKILYFDSYFTDVCSYGSNWQYVCIGSGNGFVPNRQQVITWTNDNPFHWHIYTSLGGDELGNLMMFLLCAWTSTPLKYTPLTLLYLGLYKITTMEDNAFFYIVSMCRMVPLTYWGLVMPFSHIDLGQHWLR